MKFWIIEGNYHHDNEAPIIVEYENQWLFTRPNNAIDTAHLINRPGNHYAKATSIQEIVVSTDELLSLILNYGRKAAMAKLYQAILLNDDREIVISRTGSLSVSK